MRRATERVNAAWFLAAALLCAMAGCSAPQNVVSSGSGREIAKHATAPTVDDELHALVKGMVAVHAPDKMQIEETAPMTVRISRDTDAGKILEGLGSGGQTSQETIQVGPFMTVKVDGGDGFKIVNHTAEDQVVPPQGFAEWSYDATAISGGEQHIAVTVGVRLKVGGGKDEVRYYPVYRKDIEVTVTPVERISLFLKSYWQWLVGTLLAIAGLVLTILQLKKKKAP